MASEMPVTPEMIAAGWSIVNDGRKWPPRIGSGPGLVEVYRAMRALEPATTHQRTLEALGEAKKALELIRDGWPRTAPARAADAALARTKEPTNG